MIATDRKEAVIQTRITRDKKKRVTELAREQGMSPVDFVRYLIDKEIERRKDSKKVKGKVL